MACSCRARSTGWSLPSWERGLKSGRQVCIASAVVSLSFAGAWIEMVNQIPTAIFGMSLPSRERGLKLRVYRLGRPAQWSLPSRERGLKLGWRGVRGDYGESLPSREHGLKYRQVSCLQSHCHQVAPFAGVWIEISGRLRLPSPDAIAPFAGARIEICSRCSITRPSDVAPFTGAWIEISGGRSGRCRSCCRSLHGSVD